MWVPVFSKDELWAGMRSTQRSDSMHSVFDKYLNSMSSLLQFVRQYQNCVINKEQKELECDAADLRGIIPCREYTNSMFRDVQDQFIKKADCDISSINHHGTSIVCEFDQQKMSCIARSHQKFNVIALCSNQMVFYATTCPHNTFYPDRVRIIDIDRSDESMTIFRELCSDFYNVAQDFMATPEVAAILRDAMDSARHKLKEHKEFEYQAAHVPSAINSHRRDECPVSMDELQGPRRVLTRGRPTSTRLGADLENFIKKRARKHKNTHNHNKVNMISALFSRHLFILSVLKG
ncbi:hypothetical protein AHAS_Ahas17G0124600 [Arachis hypogaea]